jgi:hypothetical protein
MRGSPQEYRIADRMAASQYLKTLRGASAMYNQFGLYMLQVEEIGFKVVKGIEYVESGVALEQLWNAHLDTVEGGFNVNKTLPILGGAAEDLARKVPGATFADIMPPHLFPPSGMDILHQPRALHPNAMDPKDTDERDEHERSVNNRNAAGTRGRQRTHAVPVAGTLPVPRGRTARAAATDLSTC